MGKTVQLPDVRAQIDRYGPLASLVTVGGDLAPHIGTVLVEVTDEGIEARVGSTTRGNVQAHRAVTLAWLRDEDDYQLILDGTATAGDDVGDDGLYPMTITVDRGILHRVAGRADAGPSCLALSDAAAG
jgi:hypothetical protein